MSPSFDLEAPDRFTAGAVGPPGQRIFYLQGRESGVVVTLRCEKEHLRALAHFLASLLAKLPATSAEASGDPALLEPLDPAWIVASMGVGYERARDRIVIEAHELLEEEEEETTPRGDRAAARFQITRAQAAAFVERAQALVKAGRPICPMCSGPIDPGGHMCPRANGHVVHPA